MELFGNKILPEEIECEKRLHITRQHDLLNEPT